MQTLEECKSISNSTIDLVPIFEPMVQRRNHRKQFNSRFTRIALPNIILNKTGDLHRYKFLHTPKKKNNNIGKKRRHSVVATSLITPRRRTKGKATSVPARNKTKIRKIRKTPLSKRKTIKRRIKPKLIEMTLNKKEVNKYLVIRNQWILKHPTKRKIETKLFKKRRRIIKPELIGNISNDSIIFMNQLNNYFNSKDAMFNEQNFSQYTNPFDNAPYQYDERHYGYLRVNDDNSTPIIRMSSDKEELSDISISSNPADPITPNLYRRKMIKDTNNYYTKTPNKQTNPNKLSKITDYFSPVSTK